jgi:hypothetical protein
MGEVTGIRRPGSSARSRARVATRLRRRCRAAFVGRKEGRAPTTPLVDSAYRRRPAAGQCPERRGVASRVDIGVIGNGARDGGNQGRVTSGWNIRGILASVDAIASRLEACSTNGLGRLDRRARKSRKPAPQTGSAGSTDGPGVCRARRKISLGFVRRIAANRRPRRRWPPRRRSSPAAAWGPRRSG